MLEKQIQSQTKYLEQNTEFQKYWTGKEEFDIHLCVVSDSNAKVKFF